MPPGISTRAAVNIHRPLKCRNPENQQQDDESRCFLEEIPPREGLRDPLGASPPPLRQEKRSTAAVSNFKAFPLWLPSPGSRAHPCLSDFLRLSPSVSHPLSLRAPPPGSLSPCIELHVDITFSAPPHLVLLAFYILWCPPRSFITPLNLQCSASFHILIVYPAFRGVSFYNLSRQTCIDK